MSEKLKPDKLAVAVDPIIFTVIQGDLKVLLIRRKYEPFKGKFALPGGFIKAGESIKDAVNRELKEETNIETAFIRHVGTYGDVNRDPRGRVISIAYLALVRPDQKLIASTDAEDATWFSTNGLPELAFDHKVIIEHALMQLKYEIQTTNIAVQILPQRFTLTQLQMLYEAVLGRELDKRNFRKRLKELDILKETKETWMEGAHRPAVLYEFKSKVYDEIKDKINVFLS